MISPDDPEWMDLTFSQRMGEAPLPAPLDIKNLNAQFKASIYRVLKDGIDFARNRVNHQYSEEYKLWNKLMKYYFIDIREAIPSNVTGHSLPSIDRFIEDMIYRANYHTTLTFIEYLLNNFKELQLNDGIIECFESKNSPYSILRTKNKLFIMQLSSLEQRKSVEKSLETLNKSDMAGATKELADAAKYINKNDYGAAISRSILAVEAVLHKITGTQKPLGKALQHLKSNGIHIHPQLHEGLEKLYAYANAEKGIRHAKGDDEGRYDLDEALLMFGICASIAAFLATKYQKQQANQ